MIMSLKTILLIWSNNCIPNKQASLHKWYEDTLDAYHLELRLNGKGQKWTDPHFVCGQCLLYNFKKKILSWENTRSVSKQNYFAYSWLVASITIRQVIKTDKTTALGIKFYPWGLLRVSALYKFSIILRASCSKYKNLFPWWVRNLRVENIFRTKLRNWTSSSITFISFLLQNVHSWVWISFQPCVLKKTRPLGLVSDLLALFVTCFLCLLSQPVVLSSWALKPWFL